MAVPSDLVFHGPLAGQEKNWYALAQNDGRVSAKDNPYNQESISADLSKSIDKYNQSKATFNNPEGFKTFGASGQAGLTAGLDERGINQNIPRSDFYNNTLHGVNITVNDWAYAKGNANDFDTFSASLQTLDPLRGTQEAEDEIRNMLDTAGFAYTDDQIAYWLVDQGEGEAEAFAGAAPEAPRPSIINDFHSRIDTAAEATREEITKPGAGHESTVKVPKTLAAVNARPVTNNNAPKAPSDRVTNPSTGVIYNSPAEARRAGVVNWVYLSEEQVA